MNDQRDHRTERRRPTTGIPTLDPFLWQNGHIRDLGTLGGGYGSASCVNDLGDLADGSQAPDQAFHGFLWPTAR